MHAVLRQAEKAAGSAIPVLIEGQSGVGKELIARAIHGCGERRAKPFVAVNCGAIPDNLVESLLFGHEKGAFTGATERHIGKFVEASGGTLFLDEVGELPPTAQVKLLRAIQEGEVEPVGARKPIKVDVRLMSATNRNLIDDVQARPLPRGPVLSAARVPDLRCPPLADRPEDIPDLAWHFLARFSAEEGKRIRAVTPEALALLRGYAWPGNVRQLENAVFRAVVLAETDEIGVSEFPADRSAAHRLPARSRRSQRARGRPAVSLPCRRASLPPAAQRPCRRPSPCRCGRTPCCRSGVSPCSMRTAMSARSRRSRTRRFASPSPIAAGRCRTSHGGCGSAARPSIASSRSFGFDDDSGRRTGRKRGVRVTGFAGKRRRTSRERLIRVSELKSGRGSVCESARAP